MDPAQSGWQGCHAVWALCPPFRSHPSTERLAEYCWNSTVWSLEFDETVPSVFHAYTSQLRPVRGFFLTQQILRFPTVFGQPLIYVCPLTVYRRVLSDISLSLSIYIYIHTYIHTYIHSYIHTYIHTYNHTTIQPYKHTTYNI